jgi:outer membrane cobalamin receptor
MKAGMVLVLGFMLVFACPGFAEENASKNEASYEPYSLGEVVISAKKTGSEKIGTTMRITAAEIESSGARTLDEVIDLLPGVYVRIGNSGTPRVDIRGFRTRHVILLLDGIPFNSTYDGQFDPTTIPVENIAEVKVITGGGSVLYGPGGNGGIINIITKKARKGLNGSVMAEAGNENARIGRATLSGATERIDGFVSGSINKKDGFPVSDFFEDTAYEDGDRRDNSDFERKNIDANAGFTVGDSLSIGLRANHLEGKNGVPAVVNYDRNNPFTKRPKYDRVDDLEGNAFQVAFSHISNAPVSLRGWLYSNQQDALENRYDTAACETRSANGAYSRDSTSKIHGAHLQTSLDMNTLGSVTLALISEAHQWDAEGFTIINNRGDSELLDSKADYRLHSAALEYGISPLDGLDLVLGGGYHMMNKDAGDDESGAAWLLGASYDLLEKTKLKASFARKIRFPSIRDLYDPASGNPDLKPEKSLHYETGISQGIGNHSEASLTLFQINAEDFIEKNDSTSLSENYEDNRFKGFEIAFDSRPADVLSLRASYGYLDATDEAAHAEREELQNRPRHKYGLETTFRYAFGLMLHGDILRVTDQFFYDTDNTAPLMKKELKAYTLLNVKVSQGFLNNTLVAHAGVDNIIDENYEQSYGLPQAGRTWYGGLTYRF